MLPLERDNPLHGIGADEMRTATLLPLAAHPESGERPLICVVATLTGGTAVSAVLEMLKRNTDCELAGSSAESGSHGRDARATGEHRNTARRILLLPLLLGALCLVAVGAAPASQQPSILRDVGIDQKLNAQVPPDLIFHDEMGRDVRLGDYFGKRPMILALVYFKCPMLCTMVLNDLTKALNSMKMNCGEQFDILTVSFDPNETPTLAQEKKAQYIRAYRREHAEEGWHFLTGSQASIESLTKTVGFRYAWDPKYKQYAHASGLIILTPEGKTARYFYGIDYAPSDLELSLAEASHGKETSVADRVLLFCFHYDPTTGRYSLMVVRLIQAGGILTLVLLGSYMLWNFRRDRRRHAAVTP